MEKISLSIVIPVYAGEDYLAQLSSELDELRTRLSTENSPLQLNEAIFVDDASQDGSAAVLEELAAHYSWLRVITLSKNFGQHPATIAGILHSSGDWVATLDEDLQHRPQHLLELLRVAVTERSDIVYAHPLRAVHGKTYRDLSSRLIKQLLVWGTGNEMVRHFNSFRLIRGTVARSAASVCGHETYFDIALSWFVDKFSSLDLPMQDVRFVQTGKSGYSFRKLLSHARRLTLSSQPQFLRLGAALGFVSVMLAILLGGKALYSVWFATQAIEVRGWTSLFVSILFFGGVSALLLGIMLEYLTNIVLHTQGKPVFFQVDRRLDKVLLDYFSNTEK